jgi:hypothetical protein
MTSFLEVHGLLEEFNSRLTKEEAERWGKEGEDASEGEGKLVWYASRAGRESRTMAEHKLRQVPPRHAMVSRAGGRYARGRWGRL